mmetsp:Transcript_5021/g.11170  ORF Transcript_5021/g.11170 Transcript_5021/m.11170 type:complete len:447 (+) Transcript_5021:118-1458(+)
MFHWQPFLTAVLLFLYGGGIPSHNKEVLALDIDSVKSDSLVWEARLEFPGGGRHHPITFANATHGFVLSGSTLEQTYTSDFWAYEEATDSWTNLTGTDSAFPGAPRSFGYGVASTIDCGNTKAYVGFGAGQSYYRFNDWWEFDMVTHTWRQLANFPGEGRRHPAMNFLEPVGEIHVGLGDGMSGNYNDYWSYDIKTDAWQQLEDFPSSKRHHPFYFAIDADSYVGLGHSNGYEPFIERDWYRYNAFDGTWNQEGEFASYRLGTLNQGIDTGRLSSDILPVTTEARVAGTQFSVAGSCGSDQTLGFVLSGDGDNHGFMATGEFHVFDPVYDTSIWHSLPPHPGFSRWAPGSFVLQGSSRVFLIGGYDREERILFSDLWTIDLEPLFDDESSLFDNNTTTYDTDINEEIVQISTMEQNAISSSAITTRSSWDCSLSVILAISFLALVV